MRTVGLLISGFLIGLVVACGGSSAADTDDITQAQMQAAITAAVAPLQAQIATIQGELPHNIIIAHGTSAMGVRTMAILPLTGAPAATTVSAFTATFLGPPSGGVIGMTQQVGLSNSTNYLFVSNADGSVESAGLPVTIVYEGLNCTGNAFTILASGISQANVNQGMVFGTGAIGDTVASDYLMLKAGETPVPDTGLSELGPGAPCFNIGGAGNSYPAVYMLVQNDQTVSGVPSGPFSSTTLGP